jgi:hypothetical protein
LRPQLAGLDGSIARSTVDQVHRRTSGTSVFSAPAVAYIVCELLGVDSADYSFGYVAGWGGGEDAIGRIRQSGQRIQQTAQSIIEAMSLSAEPAA